MGGMPSKNCQWRGEEKTIFNMYAFFIVINISPCHGNPNPLPNLDPKRIMSRHPKRKFWMGGMSNKNVQVGGGGNTEVNF